MPLVQVEGVAAEAAVLHAPPALVLLAVQVDQDIGHDHFALVVQGLAEVLLPVGVLGVGKALDREDVQRRCAHLANLRV